MQKKFKILLIALPLAAVAFMMAGRAGRGVAVEVTHPVLGQAVKAIYATGTVEASVMMPIASRVAARLTELNVDEGSDVTKGQQLAQLEDADVQNALRELRTREDFARRDYERNAQLVKRGILAKQAFDKSQTDWVAAKSATARAEAEANYLRLTAPADGRIIRRDGEIGQLIAANQAVFWLSCCAPLRISAEVDEEDIAGVQPNQKVLIRADAFPDQIFNGVVQTITPKGDPVARSYRVRIGFVEENIPLLIGMTTEVNIILQEKENALLVPVGAIEKNQLWVAEDGHAKQRSVTLGIRGREKIEILEGASEKDLVLVKRPAGLSVGDRLHEKLLP
jgi:multidrug efflux system membrane fusion protein